MNRIEKMTIDEMIELARTGKSIIDCMSQNEYKRVVEFVPPDVSKGVLLRVHDGEVKPSDAAKALLDAASKYDYAEFMAWTGEGTFPTTREHFESLANEYADGDDALAEWLCDGAW